MFRTDDPVADFLRHDAERQSRQRRRPKCCDCGEHIQDEQAYFIDGNWYCEACMNEYKQTIDEDEL